MEEVEQANGQNSYLDEVVEISRGELTRLRRDAAYWKSQFEIRKRKTQRLLSYSVRLKSERKKLWHRLFGKKTEVKKNGESDHNNKGGKRGKKPGSTGAGRKVEEQLPFTIEPIDLAEDKKKCRCCGLEFELFPKTSDSEIIEIDVKAHRRVIQRKRYKKTCQCADTPAIMTAPQVPQIIPKGKYGVTVWVFVLLQKFWFHQPLNRVVKALWSYGLEISASTLIGGFHHIESLLSPIYQAIEGQNQSEHYWHADETRWMVYVQIDGKAGHRWYLWVFRSETTVFFKIASTRGRTVVDEHFRDSWGIVSVDRYSTYKVLLSTGRFLLAFCWAHVRRDFLEIETGYVHLAEWSRGWVERINVLYHLNNQRIVHKVGSPQFAELQLELEKEIGQMKLDLDSEARKYQVDAIPARRSVLKSLQNHWSGLTLFVKFSWVPMDNNTAERSIRGPVVGRKNYYGCGSLASAQLTSQMQSILGTLDLWGINANRWMTCYFDACAKNKGRAPENIDEFLPWKMSNEELVQLGSQPESRPLSYSKITKEEIQCATVDECFLKKKSKSSDKSFVNGRNLNIGLPFQERFVSNSTGASPMAG